MNACFWADYELTMQISTYKCPRRDSNLRTFEWASTWIQNLRSKPLGHHGQLCYLVYCKYNISVLPLTLLTTIDQETHNIGTAQWCDQSHFKCKGFFSQTDMFSYHIWRRIALLAVWIKFFKLYTNSTNIYCFVFSNFKLMPWVSYN